MQLPYELACGLLPFGGMRARSLIGGLGLVVALGGCTAPTDGEGRGPDIGKAEAELNAAERRMRAGQIRDAAAASGITQGYLLAGIADAETQMAHCWSELTWACKGPPSPDCGGGPVVAGAGDGPCYLREGGLGMFQFDAGTFDDTLAREGDRILRIDGNVAAGVDFVVNMVIRSRYVDGVNNAEQAIEWINGVRVDNGRFHPWIQTVTHYYNGCLPSYSCYDSRYAHYRDNTLGVHREMGGDFWDASADYAAEYVDQSFPLARDPFVLAPGEEVPGYIEMRNTGEETWRPGETHLGTTEPRDGESALHGPDWISPSRPATVDGVVEPGGTGRFELTLRAPMEEGDYPQFFNLVQEGVAWFSESGGPPDAQLQVRVTVDPSLTPPCPDDIGVAWICDGTDRARCVDGELQRESCEHGCIADGEEAACAAEPVDADGDGYTTAEDCDDGDPDIHPDAEESCDDGVDRNCDGVTFCGLTADGADASDAGSGSGISGGCAVGGDPVTGWGAAVLPTVALLLVGRRRRQARRSGRR